MAPWILADTLLTSLQYSLELPIIEDRGGQTILILALAKLC